MLGAWAAEVRRRQRARSRSYLVAPPAPGGPTLGLSVRPNGPRFSHVSLRRLLPPTLLGLCAGLLLTAQLACAAESAARPGPGAGRVEDSLGQRLKACTVCHGATDRVTADAYFPRIAGKPAGYLYQQLLNFREGRRQYGPMRGLLAGLSDEYLHEIAGYFAALELPHAAPAPVTAQAAEMARGEALVRQGVADRDVPACVACHGETLTGLAPSVPGLVGLPKNYLVAQFGAWRSAQRQARAPDCMAQIVRRLQPDELNAIAQWLAGQPLPADSRPVTQAPAAWPMDCGGLQGTAGAAR